MNYEKDDTTFDAEAYQVDEYDGIAWYVLGWETIPNEDTEWSGVEERTGQVICIMVGDNKRFTYDPSDVKPIDREDYCEVCGQIGCECDGYDRNKL